MPAVTQRVDDYLGGVSRQSDDKKLPGQVESVSTAILIQLLVLQKDRGFNI